ncbi:uncharacterized protein [Cicer arietinum]|uniref:uncharacterized protein isoform X2 n=1 Tax=Cicer arietinum TaxID=3827 RepID=UPI00032A94C3
MSRVVPLSLKVYYCPDSGQNFLTYANLIRYVEYAKRRRFGIYSPSFKAVRKTENDAKKKSTVSTIPRKTSAVLSLRGKPVPADQNNDSKSSGSDGNKDEDYVPKRDAGVPARLGIDIAGKVLIAKNKKRVD